MEAMRQLRPRLIVNGVRTAQDIKLGFAVSKVCHRYFGVEADYLGYVNHDDAVRKSILARQPVTEFAPNSDAAIYLQRIARKLIGSPPAEAVRDVGLASSGAHERPDTRRDTYGRPA